MESNGMTVNEE